MYCFIYARVSSAGAAATQSDPSINLYTEPDRARAAQLNTFYGRGRWRMETQRILSRDFAIIHMFLPVRRRAATRVRY